MKGRKEPSEYLAPFFFSYFCLKNLFRGFLLRYTAFTSLQIAQGFPEMIWYFA